jgi:hypothetical protein
MALLGRILVIVFALAVASVAAGLVVTFGLLLPEFSDLAAEAADHGVLGVVIGFAAVVVSAFAVVPALLLILVAEAFAIRSVLVYALAGGALALFYYAGLGFGWTGDRFDSGSGLPFRSGAEILGAAGIAFGFVYWAIAGRRAGAWRAGV